MKNKSEEGEVIGDKIIDMPAITFTSNCNYDIILWYRALKSIN